MVLMCKSFYIDFSMWFLTVVVHLFLILAQTHPGLSNLPPEERTHVKKMQSAGFLPPRPSKDGPPELWAFSDRHLNVSLPKNMTIFYRRILKLPALKASVSLQHTI